MAKIEEKVLAVCDAGPLIHLDELSCLDLLSDWRVCVPSAVWKEIEFHHPAVLELPNIERKEPPLVLSNALLALAQSLSLDLGELEALAIMESTPDAMFLTDDAAARLVAQKLGYRVHGTVGVIIRAVRHKLRSSEAVIGILKALPARSTLYIRASLLSDIIRKSEEEFRKGLKD